MVAARPAHDRADADVPRVVTSLVVTLGDLSIRWAPASESDRLPVELRDTTSGSVITFTDLDGLEGLRDALAQFVEHHRPTTRARDGLPAPAGSYADPGTGE